MVVSGRRPEGLLRKDMSDSSELIGLMADASLRGAYVKSRLPMDSDSIAVIFPNEISESDPLLKSLERHRNDLVRLVRSADRVD